LALCSVATAKAQFPGFPGFGEGSGGSGGSAPAAGSGSGAGSGAGAGGSAPAPVGSADIVIPEIGTHYDDPAKAHYEPEYVNQDTNIQNMQGIVISRPYLRNEDIKYRKRVWRVIDTRQKMNKCWVWPRQPVRQIFWDLATKGLVKAYRTDSFNFVITPEDILRLTADIKTVSKQREGSEDPDDLVDSTFPVYFTWEEINKFEIMEDWVFDYKHGELKPIIIGIAPIREIDKGGGLVVQSKPYWLKMDDCRPTLAKSEVFNRTNDAMRLNWDQYMNLHRMFDSYIVKTSEWNDQYIYDQPDYKQNGLAALLRAEEFKNTMFIWEHDLWEY